jgi:histidine ammonia-lyase
VITLGDRPLELGDYDAVVARHEPVELAEQALARVDRGREAMLEHVAAGASASSGG